MICGTWGWYAARSSTYARSWTITLDDVPGLGPTTLENLCASRISGAHSASTSSLAAVRVWREGMGDSCTLRGEVVGTP
jgi:hypothetical protein